MLTYLPQPYLTYLTRRRGRLLNEFVNYKALEPLNQNGCNNKNINIIHNVTAACLASGCEIVSLCDVFPLRDLQDVSPAMSGVNLTRSITQGMQAARAIKDNSLCKL